jgi:hypothetical protein
MLRITSSYYFAGAQLVAMREMTNTGGVTNTLREAFLHTDHLRSNSITTNASGAKAFVHTDHPSASLSIQPLCASGSVIGSRRPA